MKKLLFIFLLFTACKEEAQVTPDSPLTGTTWIATGPGAPGKKVLQFTRGQKVRIDYKINGAVYFPVGTFDYQIQGSKFWVINADGTRTDGSFSEYDMVFAGEQFKLEEL